MLDHLVEFHFACELDGVDADAEIRVCQDFGGGGYANGVDYLAIEFAVDGGDVGKFDADFFGCLEHPGGLDRAAFIPEKEDDTGNQHQETGADAAEAVLQPASIGSGGCFCVSHIKKWLSVSYRNANISNYCEIFNRFLRNIC